jgi:hypothetical protein
MKRLLVAGVLALGAGCGAKWYLQQPLRLDEYPAVRVRVYYTGLRCRIEVSTATETIHTAPTRCVTVPIRVTP